MVRQLDFGNWYIRLDLLIWGVGLEYNHSGDYGKVRLATINLGPVELGYKWRGD